MANIRFCEKHKKEYLISSYECDRFGLLRIRSLFNIFQDLADIHANMMGIGYDFCSKKNMGWIGGYYHLKIERLPSWGERVILSTWPSRFSGVSGIREFELKSEDGERLACATSQWILIDVLKNRPVSIQKNIGEFELLEERSIESDFPKIEGLGHIDMEQREIIREDDIDINSHVNNAVYPALILDAISEEYLSKHKPTEMQIQFKHSAKRGYGVTIKTEMDTLQTLHSIVNPDSDIEYARVRAIWSERDAKE